MISLLIHAGIKVKSMVVKVATDATMNSITFNQKENSLQIRFFEVE